VSAFHPSLVGLTGSPDEIRKVANGYKAYYVKMPDERSGEYSIDHAGIIYMMGRNGEYLGFMPPQTNPERLTEILRKNLAK
jgi:protein SCO1